MNKEQYCNDCPWYWMNSVNIHTRCGYPESPDGDPYKGCPRNKNLNKSLFSRVMINIVDSYKYFLVH
jgi:hypothetical protein